MLLRISTLAVLLAAATPVAALDLEVRVSGGGATVSDLTAVDFTVQDGGARTVTASRYVSDLSELKIYIAVQTSGTDFPRVRQALEAFLSEDLPEGVEISLGGAPFSADRDVLLGYLEAGANAGKNAPSSGLVRIWDTGRAYQIQGDPGLAPFATLAAQLAAVPGHKAVALFRPDIRLDRQGLDVTPTARIRQSRENFDSDVARSQETLDRLGTVALFSRTRFYPANSASDSSMNQPGLNRIATTTEGRPLLGTNDPIQVFDLILEDARNYYVLTYDPGLEGEGRRRSIKVGAGDKSIKVRAAKGYLDIEGLASLGAPQVSLLDLDAAGGDLPIEVSHVFFRGAGGKPLCISTAAAEAASLEAVAAGKGKSVDVEVTVAGGAKAFDGSWTDLGRQGVRRVFAAKAFAAAQKKGGAPIEATLSATLAAAGRQELKTVLRDEASKRYGVSEQGVAVPDFSRPLATSTLLLTRRAVEIDKKSQTPPWGDLLDYDKTRFTPEASRVFRVGETILFTYRLYNPTPAMLQHSPEPQIALLLGDDQLDAFTLQAESRVAPGGEEIQYMGALRTDDLEPGDYVILSAVPGREDERQPYVEAKFKLAKK